MSLQQRNRAMGIDDILKGKREEVLSIARKHGVSRVRVIGSVARNEATEESDVDLLVDVEGPTTPWFPGGLVADLEDLLGRRVDVVKPDALREDLRSQVLKESISL
jgi:uncharacterized protein